MGLRDEATRAGSDLKMMEEVEDSEAENVAKWLLAQIGHIFDDLEEVMNDNQRAWLEFRR